MNGPLALRLYANAQNATPYYGFLINLRHKVQDRFYKHCSMTQLPEVGKISQSVLIFYFILFLFFFFSSSVLANRHNDSQSVRYRGHWLHWG